MQMRRLVGTLVAVGMVASVLGACSGTMDDKSSGPSSKKSADRQIVTPGKADNYYSNVSKEFELEGTIGVEMTEEEFEDEATRNEKISQRTTAVGLYLTAYMTAKLDDFFDNMDYGGFQAMVRNYSVEQEDVAEGEEGTYEVTFTIDVAGPTDLPQLLLSEGAERADGGVQFDLKMPQGATSDPEHVNRNVPRSFNPDEYSGELETVALTAEPLPDHNDSYPHYDAFVQDGTYDVDVFFGHDYNEDRWDLRTAREVFSALERSGFEAPVSSFDELGPDSGPFTKTFEAPGIETDEVELQIRLYHSDMFEGARDEHKETAVESLRNRDVFYYWGHAGPYYGFSLGPNSRADIGYQEIAEMDLTDKKQLVIASGCQTYSQYADMLFANPAKSEENLDVVTTVNYSNLAAGDAILNGLVDVSNGQHEPHSFYELVEQVNAPWATRRMDTFYGVIGIDGNPQIHPYANVDGVGESCQSDRDCGAHGNANVCVEGSCAVRALAEGACPADTRFGMLGSGDRLQGGVCY